jgi:hypothetical protein
LEVRIHGGKSKAINLSFWGIKKVFAYYKKYFIANHLCITALILFFTVGEKIFFITFASLRKGRVAEWLGRGLQNLIQRFESALDLILILYNAVSQSLTALCFYIGAVNEYR